MHIIFLTDVPSAPGAPEVLEVTDNSITLHWKEPVSDGNSPLTEYIIEHHKKDIKSCVKFVKKKKVNQFQTIIIAVVAGGLRSRTFTTLHIKLLS